MRSASQVESIQKHEPGRDQHPRSHRCGPWGRPGRPAFFGLEAESMGPRAQVAVALTTLVPVALSGVFLVAFFPSLWWIFTTYGWISFPAFGLLVRGLAGLASEPSGRQRALAAAESEERELLGALEAHGELTPIQAAMETSLTVSEAERRLKELAEGGHLEVRVRGGGIFYALWDTSCRPGWPELLDGGSP